MNGRPPIDSFSAVEKNVAYVGYCVTVLHTGPLSSTATERPARIALIAAARPHGPAPTTATSTTSITRAPLSVSTPMIWSRRVPTLTNWIGASTSDSTRSR
jgi:hypothetical protein